MAQLALPHPTPPTSYPHSGFVDIHVLLSVGPDAKSVWPEHPLLQISKHALIAMNLPPTGLLRYLAFVCYCITGSKGCLSTSINFVAPAPSPSLVTPSTDVLYFIASENGFPVDPTCDKTSYTRSSCRDPEFLNAVAEREGRRCPFTKFSYRYCTASHIIRNNRGDNYMELLSSKRKEEEDEVDAIDNPRNGLFVSMLVHRMTADGSAAILRTPIPELLDSSDLHANAGQNEDLYTIHYIKQDVYNPNEDLVVTPNHHVQVVVHADYPLPSRFLLNVTYGVHALNAWRNPEFNEKYLQEWKEPYYSDAIIRERQERADRRSHSDADAGRDVGSFDVGTMDLNDPYMLILWFSLTQNRTSTMREDENSATRGDEGVPHWRERYRRGRMLRDRKRS